MIANLRRRLPLRPGAVPGRRATWTSVSECNCSICTMKGIVHLWCRASGSNCCAARTRSRTYKFGTDVAKHTFCRHCGIHSFYTPRSGAGRFSVNVRCLDGVDVDAVQPRPVRRRHWEEAMRARLESGDASDVTGAA